jgi:hypothetical protein
MVRQVADCIGKGLADYVRRQVFYCQVADAIGEKLAEAVLTTATRTHRHRAFVTKRDGRDHLAIQSPGTGAELAGCDDSTMSVGCIIGTADRDRVGDEVPPSAYVCINHRANPVVLYSHQNDGLRPRRRRRADCHDHDARRRLKPPRSREAARPRDRPETTNKGSRRVFAY